MSSSLGINNPQKGRKIERSIFFKKKSFLDPRRILIATPKLRESLASSCLAFSQSFSKHLPDSHHGSASNIALMARIFRQRLAVGLSTLLDLGAVALFFIQSAVGDADWIKDEFLDYKFWESVSDLGVCFCLFPILWQRQIQNQILGPNSDAVAVL